MFLMLALVLALGLTGPMDSLRHGTALAALRDNDEIAIAADSRVIDGLGLRQPDACKLRVFGDTVAGIHGIADDQTSAFDLFALTAQALAAHDDLASAARRLATAAAGPLARAIEGVLADDPLLIRKAELGSNPAGVALARSERGTPKLAYVRFGMRTDAAGAVSIQSEVRLCPGQCPTGAEAILVSPDAAAESTFQVWHPEYWKQPLAPQAQAFVTTQASGIFGGVGPPIDVVRIAHGQITWTARKEGCREKE